MVVASLILSIGLHWHALQVVAWANMIRQDTPEKGLKEAIARVVEGDQPCKLCSAIRSAQLDLDTGDSENPTAPVNKSGVVDKDVPRVTRIVFGDHWERRSIPPELNSSPQDWTAGVPSPPPKALG